MEQVNKHNYMTFFLDVVHTYSFYLMDKYYDRRLKIHTDKYILLNNKSGYSNYQPTPYLALKKLFKYQPFTPNDHFVDFGSGKGRTVICSSYFGCMNASGVEINEEMHSIALENVSGFTRIEKRDRISFHLCPAEAMNISPNMNKFFFNNPFDLKYFMKTTDNILSSVREFNRTVFLYLYSPNEYYTRYLNRNKNFNHTKRISTGLFHMNYPYIDIYTTNI